MTLSDAARRGREPGATFNDRVQWTHAVNNAPSVAAVLELLELPPAHITASDWRGDCRPTEWAGWTEGAHPRVMVAHLLHKARAFGAAFPRLRSAARRQAALDFFADARLALEIGGRWGRPVSAADVAEVNAAIDAILNG